MQTNNVIYSYDKIEKAKAMCLLKGWRCGGVTEKNGMYELRGGREFYTSTTENSWLKLGFRGPGYSW